MTLRILAPLAVVSLLAAPAMAATGGKTAFPKHHVVKAKAKSKVAAKPATAAAKTSAKAS